VSTY